MLFPAVPRAGSMARTLTQLVRQAPPVLVLAVTGTLALPFRRIAAATFVATIAVVAGAFVVQKEKFVPVLSPSVPPARGDAPQANPFVVVVGVRVLLLPSFPAVAAVSLTVLTVALA